MSCFGAVVTAASDPQPPEHGCLKKSHTSSELSVIKGYLFRGLTDHPLHERGTGTKASSWQRERLLEQALWLHLQCMRPRPSGLVS